MYYETPQHQHDSGLRQGYRNLDLRSTDSPAQGLLIGLATIVSIPLTAAILGPTAAGIAMFTRVRLGILAAGGAAIALDARSADIPIYSPSQLGALTGETPTRTETPFLKAAVSFGALSAMYWWLREEYLFERVEVKRSGYSRSGKRRKKSGYKRR